MECANPALVLVGSMQVDVFPLILCVQDRTLPTEGVLDVISDTSYRVGDAFLAQTPNPMIFYAEDGMLLEFVLSVPETLSSDKTCVLPLILSVEPLIFKLVSVSRVMLATV